MPSEALERPGQMRKRELRGGLTSSPRKGSACGQDAVPLTGFKSASLSPIMAVVLLSLLLVARPSISTTIMNLTPVLVSQPYIAIRSSTAWRRPKSCSAVLYGMRASKISRHDERRKENSRGARSSGEKREIWRGLFCGV